MPRSLVSKERRAAAGALILAFGLAASLPANGQPQSSGKDIYARACADCHQPNGAGLPGAFPALAHDPLVNGAPSLGARIVLEGAGPMPDFDNQLSDAQIAAVLSYVRSSFGNTAPPVPAALVAGVRAKLAH